MASLDITKFCDLLSIEYPSPRVELEFDDEYTLLVAVVLSAQATDKSVNAVTRTLFKVANTPAGMLKLGYENLCHYIRSIGLYRNKAKNIIGLSQKLIDDFGGQVPKTREELMILPGVGRKTANVVLNHAFKRPTIAVDTHVFRVSHRLHLSSGSTPEKVEADLENLIPDKYKLDIGYRILLHGRYICKAKKPLCGDCKMQEFCPYFQEIK